MHIKPYMKCHEFKITTYVAGMMRMSKEGD